MVDLLDGLTFGPTTVNDVVADDYFAQHFWVSKNTRKHVLFPKRLLNDFGGFYLLLILVF